MRTLTTSHRTCGVKAFWTQAGALADLSEHPRAEVIRANSTANLQRRASPDGYE